MLKSMHAAFAVLLVTICSSAYSQSKVKLEYNEGGVPRATYYVQGKDSLAPLQFLKKGVENKVLIRIEGGMTNVKLEKTVTSKQALVVKSETEKNVYYITPLADGTCEIIVDVTLEEEYIQVKIVTKGKKQTKEIVKTYLPRKYMIGYDQFEIR